MNRKINILIVLALFMSPITLMAQSLNDLMKSEEAKKVDRVLQELYNNANSAGKATNNKTSGTAKVPGSMNRSESNAKITELQRQNATNIQRKSSPKPASYQANTTANHAALNSLLAKKRAQDDDLEGSYDYSRKAFEDPQGDDAPLKWTDAQGKEFYYREKAVIDREIKNITDDVVNQADKILDTYVKRTGWPDKIPLKINPDTLNVKMQSDNHEEAGKYIKEAMKETLKDAGWNAEGVESVVEDAAGEEVEASVSPAVDKVQLRLQQLEKTKNTVNERCEKECIK